MRQDRMIQRRLSRHPMQHPKMRQMMPWQMMLRQQWPLRLSSKHLHAKRQDRRWTKRTSRPALKTRPM
jgi:hypothetical protein